MAILGTVLITSLEHAQIRYMPVDAKKPSPYYRQQEGVTLLLQQDGEIDRSKYATQNVYHDH